MIGRKTKNPLVVAYRVPCDSRNDHYLYGFYTAHPFLASFRHRFEHNKQGHREKVEYYIPVWWAKKVERGLPGELED